jgi:hypothetical protein
MGITSYLILHSSDKNNLYKNLNQNIKFDAKITKKVNSNSYFSFGGFLSTNYLLGIDPIILNERNYHNYHLPYGEIKMNFGFIFDSLNEPHLNKNTTNLKELINKNMYSKKKIHGNITETKDKIKPISLNQYALNYAQKYDISLKSNF